MQLGIKLLNLWVFYALAYAIAFPLRQWANARRGEPIEDPEFLSQHKGVLAAAMAWLVGGFVIGLFVPIAFGSLFYVGLVFYILGLAIAVLALYSFAHKDGLVTRGVYRYSRNPNYIGWTVLIFGLSLMGWSSSLWSVIFVVYFVVTIPYFHWTVLLEERYLIQKHGDSYRRYLKETPRYIGAPRR